MRTDSPQTVLLTGASGGLGKYMARAFAKPGVNLALVANPGAELELVRREIAPTGVNAMTIIADLREASERRSVVDQIESKLGTIDILINNAGVEFTQPFHELTEDNIYDMLHVNLEAAMILTRLVLPAMLKKRRGHIVNIASLAGKSGPAFEEGYAASKAGLIAFTSSLRASYRRMGVSASVIVPGFVEAGIYTRLKQRSGCTAPPIMGTSQPQQVADAVLRAIERDRFEIIVNPLPVRPLLAFAALFPGIGEWVIEKFGTNQFFREVVTASRRNQEQEPKNKTTE
jgi:short-subunit dehydrogenase